MTIVTDLPKRPETDHEAHRIVDPTERVRSVADKVDPRFDAARARLDRQAAIRARHGDSDETDGDAGDELASEDADIASEQRDENSTDSAGAKKGSFSFNLTADEPKDEQ